MLILVYFSSFPYATIIPSVSVTKGRKEFEVARFSAQPKSSSSPNKRSEEVFLLSFYRITFVHQDFLPIAAWVPRVPKDT